jgi:4-hydroxy-tetrahydrodipicolinate synthase
MKKTLSKKDLKGVLAALVTPTGNDGRFIKDATQKLLEFLIKRGVSGIVPMGGTGEFTNMSPAERIKFVEFVVKEVNGRLPVVAGILTPGFYESVEVGLDFKKTGVDGLMLVVPFYVKPTQEGIIKYFLSFMDKVQMPVILYDIPYRTMVSIDPATVRKIAEKNELLIGMKACNPDLSHFIQLILQVGDFISVLSGEEYYFMSHVLLGAKGGVLATCNIFPDAWVKIFDLLQKGDIPAAKKILFDLVPLLDAAFCEINPGPLKAGLEIIGFNVGQALLPLLSPQSSTVENLRNSIKSLKVSRALHSS